MEKKLYSGKWKFEISNWHSSPSPASTWECKTKVFFTHFTFSLFAKTTFEQSRIAESENVRFFFRW